MAEADAPDIQENQRPLKEMVKEFERLAFSQPLRGIRKTGSGQHASWASVGVTSLQASEDDNSLAQIFAQVRKN